MAGPIDQQTYDVYVEAWNEHKGDALRVDGPNSRPRVGCTMIVAIAPTEDEALDIARRAMEGSSGAPRPSTERPSDHVPEDCEGARRRCARSSPTSRARSPRAGTTEQIAERFAAILEPGLIDHVELQLPTGDMTFDEARRTFELFAAEVKPQLEQASLRSRQRR